MLGALVLGFVFSSHRTALAQCDFSPQEKLQISPAEASDFFGSALALEGNHLVVGARDRGFYGECVVYRKAESGWIPTQTLVPSNSTTGAWFGVSLAISGNRIAVGASGDLPGGSVEVFRFDGSRWNHEQKVVRPNSGMFDGFGSVIKLVDDVLVVGAPGAEVSNGRRGLVTVFRDQGGSWVEEQTFANERGSGFFGVEVAFDGNHLGIGSARDVEFHSLRNGQWAFDQVVVSPQPTSGEQFGASLALAGEWLAVGASQHEFRGAVYLFRHRGGGFEFFQKILGDGSTPGDRLQFGISLSLFASLLAVGTEGPSGVPGPVSLYIPAHDGWKLSQRLDHPNPGGFDGFGSPVAVDADDLVVGAILAPAGSTPNAGAVHSFQSRGAFEAVAQGTVNASAGVVRDVLFLNGSSGGEDRTVEYEVLGPFRLSIELPPALSFPDRAPFAVYAWMAEVSGPFVPSVLDLGIGCTVFPTPLVSGGPQPRIIWNNTGRHRLLGRPNRKSEPAPGRIVSRANGPGRAERFFVQGLIYDPASAASFPVSVTNGIAAVPVFGQ